MLAVGSAANRSIKNLARLCRRASPRSSCSNSCSALCVDTLANAFPQKTRVNAKSRQFARAAPSHWK